MYETLGGMDASLMPDNAFYDLNIASGSLAGLTVAHLPEHPDKLFHSHRA